MSYGYMIGYFDKDGGRDSYEIVGGSNIQEAISLFYRTTPYQGIDNEMFYKMVRQLTLEEAVAVYNSLVPKREILEIYAISNVVYMSEKLKCNN